MGQQPITFLRQVSGPSEAEAGGGSGNRLGGPASPLTSVSLPAWPAPQDEAGTSTPPAPTVSGSLPQPRPLHGCLKFPSLGWGGGAALVDQVPGRLCPGVGSWVLSLELGW